MKRIAIILTLIFVTHGVTRAQKFEPELQGYLAPDGTFISAEAAGGFQQTLIAKYLQVYSSAPTCSRVGQLYHNSATGKLGHCTVTGSPGTWEYMVSGTVAPVDATYITQTANSTLTNEQALASLSTGIMRVATTTGVVTSLTDSAGIAANISDETGSAALVFANTPTLVTPVLGAATATSINGLAITSSTGTLTIPNGVTLTGPAVSGTAATLAGSEALTNKTLNGNTFTTGTYTLTGVAGKTLTFNKSLTLDGTDSTTMTFPSTSATIARTDVANATTGTATNDSAAAGKIGEYMSSFIAQASAVSLTNITAANVTSISLTAGDWDVWGNTVFLSDTTTTVTTISTTISTTSATNDYTTGEFGNINWPAGSVLGLANTTAKVGPRRMSLASTTTVYLTAYSAFGTSTMKAWGVLSARRVR